MFQRIGFPGVTNFQVLLALASLIPTPASRDFFRLPLTVGFTGAEIVNIEFECLRQLTPGM
ncbi:capsule synthesis regulatory protein B [Klebsiella pneumoniae subsp. pneumoniae Kp13]|uniref:Colanic acid capsular biosynthesis activation protein B n=1 Tax=Klebsiella aerogenes TaxID=548 RepID=RCSB_KLEAE|nr:RecName: Full=Colanic acid capsular biosynthesis activation protein B [Klebsiella aerogenes]pir/B47615/ capsule synthesis regulatory protein B - Klebsiella pneumoniae [Klebsiella pneumoniae]AAA25143.1 rcsB protein [Klebsiella aerogenes]AHE43810.1 capsule synthesis regulatory protein B [Klebsiella pneumoniae subsp. pneumoniae Kp13]